jgi:hypothetical protein
MLQNYDCDGLSVSFALNKKEIQISNWYTTWDYSTQTGTLYSSNSFTYDGAYHNVYPGYVGGATTSSDYKVYSSDLVVGNVLSFTYSGDPNSAKNAGSYTTAAALATSLPSSNYILYTGAGNKNSLSWAIAQRIVQVSWAGRYLRCYMGRFVWSSNNDI